GKSTLLRIIAGLLQPTHGDLRGAGRSAKPRNSVSSDTDADVSASKRSWRVGFVFQDANLLPWRTVTRNIELPLESLGWQRSQAQARAAELADAVGLDGFHDRWPKELSGGM